MNKKCNAFSNGSNTKCSKKRFLNSRYCWHHQDVPLLVITIIFSIIISFSISTVFYFLQTKEPKLTIECKPEVNNYCSTECTLKNMGRAPANNIAVIFNKLLLKGTTFYTNKPGYGITLEKFNNLPDPNKDEELAELSKAFKISIPNIPPKQEVYFRVYTEDEKNRQACNFLNDVMQQQKTVLTEISNKLKNEQPNISWNTEAVINSRIKKANLYQPSTLYYENNEEAITTLNLNEILAYNHNQKLNDKLMEKYGDAISKFGSVFNLPVFSIEVSDGETLYAVFPSYIQFKMDYNETRIFKADKVTIINDLTSEDRQYLISLKPIQPDSYK